METVRVGLSKYANGRTLRQALPLIGIACLAYLVIKIGLQNIIAILLSANLSHLTLALLFLGPYMLIRTYKWDYLLRKQGFNLDFLFVLKLSFVGIFYSVLTPGKLGGLMRIAYIKRRTNRSYAESSGSVVLDQIVDMIGLFLLAGVGLIVFANYLSTPLVYALILCGGLMLAGIALLLNGDLSGKALRVLSDKLVPSGLREMVQRASQSFYSNLPVAKDLLIPCALSICGWIIIYSQSYVVAHSIGIDVPWFNFITLLPIASIVGLIPITIA